MNLFEYDDYKTYVRDRVANMPKRGRGEFRKLAAELDVSSTVVSHIFKGDRHLTTDQALQLSKYLGLNPLETKYMITLVSKDRAGTHALRQHYSEELNHYIEQSKTVKNRLKDKTDKIPEEIQAIYFSDWMYVAVQLLTALPGKSNIDEISNYFGLSRERVQNVVSFLLKHDLLREEDERLIVGNLNVHLSDKSQVINTHRRNWRVKSLERINEPDPMDLFYSLVTTITPNDSENIKSELLECLAKINKLSSKSEPEKLYCMNIDWFEVK